MKKFVILEIGYEYNDEGYDRLGYDTPTCGVPKKIYGSRESAEAALPKLIKSKLNELDGLLMYNDSYLFRDKTRFCELWTKHVEPDKTFEEYNIQFEEDYEWNIPEHLGVEETMELYKCLNLPLFEIVEVDCDDNV